MKQLILLLAAVTFSIYYLPTHKHNSADRIGRYGSSTIANHDGRIRRQLQDGASTPQDDGWFKDVSHLLNLATQSSSSQSSNRHHHREQLRVLLIITSLTEYDKGTRGTEKGYDRLQNVLLPPLIDSVTSMTNKGWKVDVYLVLGYQHLSTERRQMVQSSLPEGVGLEVWEDAIPFFYDKTYGKRPRDDQALKLGDHALSRQHRFVLRDKLPYFDFFACFVSIVIFSFLHSLISIT